MMDDTSDLLALAHAAQHKAIRRRRRTVRSKSLTGSAPSSGPRQFSPTQRLGRQAEEQAAAHVETAGAQVLERNLLCRAGEIDLVCLDDGVLAFIEVRHRHSQRFGGAAASVNRIKQLRLTRAAAYFLPGLARVHFGGRTPRCRFDVIAMDGAALTWLKEVFDATR